MYSATGRPGWPYITALIAPVKIRAASQTLCGALLCIVQEIESISSWYFGFARVHICLMFSVQTRSNESFPNLKEEKPYHRKDDILFIDN